MSKTMYGMGLLACALLALGCETMQSKTAQGALVGSAIGAGSGAIIGNQTDHAGAGTAIGAGIGAVSGALIGHAMENNQQKPQQYPSSSTTTQSSGALTQFCPVGGERYAADVKYCPIHGVELKPVQQTRGRLLWQKAALCNGCGFLFSALSSSLVSGK